MNKIGFNKLTKTNQELTITMRSSKLVTRQVVTHLVDVIKCLAESNLNNWLGIG